MEGLSSLPAAIEYISAFPLAAVVAVASECA